MFCLIGTTNIFSSDVCYIFVLCVWSDCILPGLALMCVMQSQQPFGCRQKQQHLLLFKELSVCTLFADMWLLQLEAIVICRCKSFKTRMYCLTELESVSFETVLLYTPTQNVILQLFQVFVTKYLFNFESMVSFLIDKHVIQIHLHTFYWII